MNSHPRQTEDTTRPLWHLAFRAGFLGAAVFAVLGMGRWVYWMARPDDWPAGQAPHWWHGHEMVFGFALPVVAGFLLTAVATWTGIPGTRGRRLQVLFTLWLTARVILWLAPAWGLLAWLAEMLFILLVAFELGRRVWARRQWRNMLFPPALLILAVLDTFSFRYAADPVFTTSLHYGAVWMVTVFVVIIGGRVIPLFTGNRLGLDIAPLPAWYELLCILTVAIIGLLTAFRAQPTAEGWLQPLCLLTAALHLYRMVRWQGWKTLKVPLLWSLHLSYLCIPMALLGLAEVGTDPLAEKNVFHLLAVGTVGGMILSMMSRVSLGHTGRPLEVPAYLTLAFALVLLAAVIRGLLPLLAASLSLWSWRLSALLWIMAFGCFLFRYLPILTMPRADGRPG